MAGQGGLGEVQMRRQTREERYQIAFLTLLGLLIWGVVPLTSSFPLNDGGLFYRMVLDLEANHFALPFATTYNQAEIPFAYPPLAFYLYGWLHVLLGLSLLDLMRVGPAVVSACSIPVFYQLARLLVPSRSQAMLATLVFTFTPRLFEWQIMGGGMTRSLGFLLALLAIRQAYLLFTTHHLRSLFLMILTGALGVYTHPEASLHTALSALFFYVYKDRSRRGLGMLLLVGVGVLTLTAPWWGTLLARHGVAPLVAAVRSAEEVSYNPITGLLALFQLDFTDEPFMTVVATLGALGVLLLLVQREYFLPLWIFLLHFIEPRGGILYVVMLLTVTAGLAIERILSCILPKSGSAVELNFHGGAAFLNRRSGQLLIGVLFVYLSCLGRGQGPEVLLCVSSCPSRTNSSRGPLDRLSRTFFRIYIGWWWSIRSEKRPLCRLSSLISGPLPIGLRVGTGSYISGRASPPMKRIL